MITEMKIFEHADFGQVRVMDEAGEPWFVAKDVAEILGYSDPSKMYARLDEDEKSRVKSADLAGIRNSNDLVIINESGLYNAILGSQKPEAKRFKKWVTSEILPDIRKHGFYGTDSFLDRMINDPDNLVLAIQQCKFEREQRQLAERQRDEAFRTKAQIGSRREATSMNTASQYSKKVERLLTQLGNATKWKQVTSIPWLNDYFIVYPESNARQVRIQVGRRLSKMSREMGYEIKRTPTPQYPNGVGVYHIDVIDELKKELQRERESYSEYDDLTRSFAEAFGE